MTHHSLRRRAALPLLLALALVAPACGSDAASDGAAPSGDETTTIAAEPADFDAEAYCDAELAIEQAGPDIDFDTATPEEMTAGLKAWAGGDLSDRFDAILADLPPELDDAAATFGAAIDELAESGDPSVFDAPEVVEAEATAHAFDREHCGWQQADAVATDYAFSGIEESYEPGPLSIDLTNAGDEVHELLVLKVKDGVEETAEELIQLSEEEAFAKVDFAGAIDPIAPGDDDYVVIDLEPGRYVVSCFLPEGAVDMDHLDAEGMPHALSGMVAELTVA